MHKCSNQVWFFFPVLFFLILAVRSDDSVTEENYEEDRSTSQSVEEQAETQRPDSPYLLDSINKAALCLRRAMVERTLNI